jgi:hypothetical protein
VHIAFGAFAMRDPFFHPLSASSRRFIRDGSVDLLAGALRSVI